MEYDPDGGSNGRIIGTYDDESTTISLDLTSTQRSTGVTFNRFGLVSVKHGGHYTWAYVDDVYYTGDL
jgi:hypothetical protein